MLSPPFPARFDTQLTVYRTMYVLKDWVNEERQLLTELVDPAVLEALGDTPMPPEEDHCNNQPIVYWMALTEAMRALRMNWDIVVRAHELDWDGELAVSARLSLLKAALHLLGPAFHDPKTIESRLVEWQKKLEATIDYPKE